MHPQEANPEGAAGTHRSAIEEVTDHREAEHHETYFSNNAWRTYEESYRATDAAASLNAHLGITEPGYVLDDSVIRKLLPELRANRDIRRGNRRNPERPTMLAKVCEGRGRGERRNGQSHR